MEQFYGMIRKEQAYLRAKPGEEDGQNQSTIEDEIFSGWAVLLLPETAENGWIKVSTHYGYEGYLYREDYAAISRHELIRRQDQKHFFRIGIGEADLLDQPRVQGLPLELLQRNAFVELLNEEAEGWSRIRTASGRVGYVHTKYLCLRKEDDGFLLCQGEEKNYFLKKACEARQREAGFRQSVTETARSYLGTQYRWGGKSSQGMDCSGLAFMSYMENGVLIYRDACIMEGYPIHPVCRCDLKPGDLIFFPGHVAIYLGNGKYIHSTAYEKTPCVTINSLNPWEADYREDLAGKICGYGSMFPVNPIC